MTGTQAQQVRAACEQLLADGRDVTFTAVAQTSGIARATCYRNRELRSVIDTYRSRHGELLTLTALADRIDNLTQTLDALAEKVRRQEEEIRSLKNATQPARNPRRRSTNAD
jgi:hypothetical protein